MPRLIGSQLGTNIEIGLQLARENDEFRIGPYSITPERASDRNILAATVSPHGIEGAFGFLLGEEPPQMLMSRFLAKMAIEAHWLRFDQQLTDQLIDDPHYDRIRNWARRGDNYDSWPFSSRRIFPEETLMRHPDTGKWVQAGFGFNLFLTRRRETFFAFVYYGKEFVINVGGPSIKGYDEWLKEQNQISPLVEALGLRLRSEIKGQNTLHYLE